MNDFNLTPSPALLDLLGKIPFKGWQCVAELIDNSIDAIINNSSVLTSAQKAIAVSIPTRKKIEQNEPLIIEDWGIGMTESQLENAVKAGFSSKNTTSNLGLFGMGFNVATSRLANKVEVWTSTKEMAEEIGVCIDLREMRKSQSFLRPKLTRKKTTGKKSGTRVEVFDFKSEALNLLKPQEITRELNRAYSTRIFSDHGIKIIINDLELKPFLFCIWDKSRSVKYKYEDIPAVIDIDEHLRSEMFCESCFSWLGDSVETSLDIECPHCHVIGQIVKKDIYIYGWVGIQRYSHPDHYGIDISRNGRVLSKLDKSFFHWDDERARDDFRFHPEYPRDTTYAGGRIVGQIEANFILPKYTKDDFERDDRNWRKAINFLRGEMPLQPELAGTFGYKGANRSPIGLLFNAFRKINVPGSKTLVFARDTGSVDHITPKNWAERFYEGDPEYQDDKKWWDAVTKADLKDIPGNSFDPTNPIPKSGKVGPIPTTPVGGKLSPINEKFPGKKLLKKTLRIDIEKIINEKPFELTLIDYFPDNDLKQPIIIEAPGGIGRFNVYLNNNHPLFRDFADGYEDLVYLEVAHRYSLMKNSDDWPVTRVYYEIKSKYAVETMLSVSNLVTKANSLIRDIHKKLVMGSGVDLPRLPILDETDEKNLKKKYLDLEGQKLPEIKEFISNTKFLNYLDLHYIFKFIEQFPDIVYDGNIFQLPFNELEEESKTYQLRKYAGYFQDVHWFMNELANEGDEAIRKLRPQILRNRISMEILYGSLSK